MRTRCNDRSAGAHPGGKLLAAGHLGGVLAGDVAKREGGVIWHTQGSGKSILMVLIAKWLLEHDPDARILVVTDRDELDKQIEGIKAQLDQATNLRKEAEAIKADYEAKAKQAAAEAEAMKAHAEEEAKLIVSSPSKSARKMCCCYSKRAPR